MSLPLEKHTRFVCDDVDEVREAVHHEVNNARRNLTDERYIVTGNDEIGTIGYTEAIYAREREWSLALRYRF